MYSILLSVLLNTACQSTDEQPPGAPPGTQVYVALGEDCCGEDPHAVFGAYAGEGGYVLVGKSIDTQGGMQGFVVHIDTYDLSGMVFLEEQQLEERTWSHTIDSSDGFSAANAVTVHEHGIFVVGVRSENGVPQRIVQKYSRSGEFVWEYSVQGAGESAFEYIENTPDGVILSGFVDGAAGGIEGFKSYGNPISGQAYVAFLSNEQLSSQTAPNTFQWEQTYNLNSIRAIRSVDEGYVFVAAQGEEYYEVVRINSSGSEEWKTALVDHGEATEIAVVDDGFVVTGHVQVNNGIDGSVTKIDKEGNILWEQNYGNPEGGMEQFSGLDSGNTALIFDECWGVQATEDGGAILACGTGIEGCDEVEGSLKDECESDPRTMWRSLLIKVDSDGGESWSRTDSFSMDGELTETASEYVIKADEGVYASVMDQGFGIGLMVFSQ